MSSAPCHFNITRIAPTPSGFLHIGNIMSFSITAALARSCGAKILLRIDDMDRTRSADQYIRDIFDTLNFLEIPWDDGPADPGDFERNYSQNHRLNLYGKALQRLYHNGLIYGCECSRKQLITRNCLCAHKHMPFDTPDVSWRLKTDAQTALQIKEYSRGVVQTVLPPEMENFVVKRRDGLPAYQLTSVIDDFLYGVDLVVRGQDLWASTIAQHYLALALGEARFADVTFYHHQLLIESPGKKLSKSAGSTSIKYMREQGKTAADVFGIIGSMLGIREPMTNWEQLGAFLSS